ncbi:hypothetical protein Pelo_780 [Pelomyxa schiedti]|nr:hypothetical protein Pelo_780 [Pelomyxa schiedti]
MTIFPPVGWRDIRPTVSENKVWSAGLSAKCHLTEPPYEEAQCLQCCPSNKSLIRIHTERDSQPLLGTDGREFFQFSQCSGRCHNTDEHLKCTIQIVVYGLPGGVLKSLPFKLIDIPHARARSAPTLSPSRTPPGSSEWKMPLTPPVSHSPALRGLSPRAMDYSPVIHSMTPLLLRESSCPQGVGVKENSPAAQCAPIEESRHRPITPLQLPPPAQNPLAINPDGSSLITSESSPRTAFYSSMPRALIEMIVKQTSQYNALLSCVEQFSPPRIGVGVIVLVSKWNITSEQRAALSVGWHNLLKRYTPGVKYHVQLASDQSFVSVLTFRDPKEATLSLALGYHYLSNSRMPLRSPRPSTPPTPTGTHSNSTSPRTTNNHQHQQMQNQNQEYDVIVSNALDIDWFRGGNFALVAFFTNW